MSILITTEITIGRKNTKEELKATTIQENAVKTFVIPDIK